MDNYNSFSTIDHLVEFGMGMAIAQQMVSTMNHCIGNMQIAGTGNNLNQGKSPVLYHVLVNNAVISHELSNTSDTVSAHLALRAVKIEHSHLSVCDL